MVLICVLPQVALWGKGRCAQIGQNSRSYYHDAQCSSSLLQLRLPLRLLADFRDIKFVMVSILIVSRCKYKDYFRFYKVYFHIFIVAVRGWLIHTKHETQALYTNVRTRTYAHATRQLFDHRPPITHNNLPYSILQRWSKDIQMRDRPPIDHPSISMAAYTVSPSTPFFIT